MKSENQLFDFFKTLPDPINFKDPKSGKYICANKQSATQVGLESADQMVGLTVHDLAFAQADWGSPLAKRIAHMDWLVQEKKEIVTDTAAWLNHGRLIYETVVKTPLLSSRGKVLAIATFNQDLTQRLSHPSLYLLYKKICGKKTAIQKLLQHLAIESWFFTLPTEKELLVLLERAAGRTDKEIARLHHVSVRTTETHLINLRTKLKGEALSTIIAHLRARQHGIDLVAKPDFSHM
jgi:DNA-binding CsgD family transcriptional regulator